jgi:hypothetical protein
MPYFEEDWQLIININLMVKLANLFFVKDDINSKKE